MHAILTRQEFMANSTQGVWSPLLSITLVRTVSFSIYQRSKYALDDWIYQATGSSPLVIANTKGAYPTLSTVACFGLAGAGAGATITAIACTRNCYNTGEAVLTWSRSVRADEAERTNIRLDIRKSYQNLGTLKTAQNLIKHRGWKGLYSGFHLHLRKLYRIRHENRTLTRQSVIPSVPASTL
jgi:solute carrier family 25 carnitine/acylcarnitine transporter 20/29